MAPYFVFFIGVWFYLRHYINLHILYAVLTEFRTVGPFDLNWETQQYKCWISQVITFSLLFALQAVNIFWFLLIIRILYRFAVQNVAKDERSEDEYEEDEIEQEEREEKKQDLALQQQLHEDLRREQGENEDQKSLPAPEVRLNGELFPTPSPSAETTGATVAEKRTRRRG